MFPKFRERLGPQGARWEYNDNKKTIYIRCGTNNWSEIVFKSQEAGRASYEGAKIHRLGFDEMPWEEIFDSALIRTIDTQAQVLIAATTWEENMFWLYDRFVVPVLEHTAQEEDIEIVGMDMPMEANPMLDKKAVAEQRRVTALKNPDEAAVRFDGKILPLSGKTLFNTRALQRYEENMIEPKLCEFSF